MTPRILPLAALLALLAGCHRAAPSDRFAAADAEADRIPCAIGGATAFTPVCTIERIDGAEGLELMLRNPDGGFRRLLVTKDGRGVVAADGALPARVNVVGAGSIEVTVGTDRYRLPATVKSSPGT